ncbi:hypothetical protein [Candidatus Amarolinea dominans]|uniref:hypothetical protein n=1 Tax=Candidatus Amarolinea dominans TaxID=3140696 RepID=UPI0031CC6825
MAVNEIVACRTKIVVTLAPMPLIFRRLTNQSVLPAAMAVLLKVVLTAVAVSHRGTSG